MTRPAQHIPAGAVLTDTGWTTTAGERYLGRAELAKQLRQGWTSADVKRWSHVYAPGGRAPLFPDHDPAVGLVDGGRRYLPLSAARAWLEARARLGAAGRAGGAARARKAAAAAREAARQERLAAGAGDARWVQK